jgi:signal transduction histidine kinase
MIANGDRASKIFDNIHALLGSPYQGQKPVDLNKITLGVLGVLRGELKEKGITTRLELTTELPLAMGHKGQLEEVILNLVRNAIEAMDAVKAGGRMLRVRTEHHGDAIDFSVEDSGPGINPKQGDGIFEAFVTTKPHGMGLGLAICRMIIERHNGELSMSPNKKSGALFKFILPIKSPPGSTGASH